MSEMIRINKYYSNLCLLQVPLQTASIFFSVMTSRVCVCLHAIRRWPLPGNPPVLCWRTKPCHHVIGQRFNRFSFSRMSFLCTICVYVTISCGLVLLLFVMCYHAEFSPLAHFLQRSDNVDQNNVALVNRVYANRIACIINGVRFHDPPIIVNDTSANFGDRKVPPCPHVSSDLGKYTQLFLTG